MRTLLLAICFFVSNSALLAKPRLQALIVGVDSYPGVVLGDRSPDLDKPSKDALAVAEALEKDQGFSVSSFADPQGDTSRSAVEFKWKQILDRAQDGDVVLFYFSGHGVELKGNSYLLPRDTRYQWDKPDQNKLDELAASSIELHSLLDRLAAKQAKFENLIGIFIIDACRENPFEFTEADKGKLVVELGPNVPPQRQLFILYSAGSGQEAQDGAKDDAHSVFAEQLLPLLKEKDLALSDIAQRLRFRVYKDALRLGGNQTPSYYDQLKDSVTLSGVRGQTQFFNEANLPKEFSTRSLRHGDALIECPYCPELIVLRSGSYQMGSTGQDRERKANETPRHKVEIEQFAIGKFEVTNREWNACVKGGGCGGSGKPEDNLKPVADVSWRDAKNYADWLSRKTGAAYRLATEAEWEYAARAEKGADTRYHFGDDAAQLCEYANGADSSVGMLPYANRACDDGVGRETSIVGRYRPNAWGLYDMLGNVWEWVEDCWHESYDGAPANGKPWQEADCARHVARGGSWRSGADALRTAIRNAFPADHRRSTLGFRVVRKIAE